MKNIVLIADGHPREWAILNALSRHYPSTVWIQPTYEAMDNASHNRLSIWGNKVLNLYYGLRRRVYDRLIERKAGPAAFQFERHLSLSWQDLTSEPGVQLVASCQPDLLITCRAPILQAELLALPTCCSINVHFGIVPHYRGNYGLYWALMKGDFSALGGSIHLLDNGIDTGGKLVDAYPNLSPKATFIATELAVSRVLSEALIQCLHKIGDRKKPPEGIAQGHQGRNYRMRERTFLKDLQYLMRRSHNPSPAQNQKIQFFF